MKKSLLLLATVLSIPFFFAGCGEEDEDFTTFFIRTAIEYETDLTMREVEEFFLEEVRIPVYWSVPDDQNDYITYKLKSKDLPVEFSFTVFKSSKICRLCGAIEVTKAYTGTIDYDAFIVNGRNDIEIIENGDGYGLRINGSTEGITINEEGPAGGEFDGRWVRQPGASGDRTDLAIGNIPGQPENRVYMCEKKGSSVAGLYKGTVNGSSIVWDAQYNLPVFSVSKSGSELVLDCDVCQPTNYKTGSWSGECPL